MLRNSARVNGNGDAASKDRAGVRPSGIRSTSHTPYPYQLCYCSICRKTAGGGGFAINIMGDVRTLKVKGRRSVGIYRATICDDEGGNCAVSTGERNFCRKCATALWLFDPEWPDLMHPFASAVDTPLPVPPVRTHLMLRYKAGLGGARDRAERPHVRSLSRGVRSSSGTSGTGCGSSSGVVSSGDFSSAALSSSENGNQTPT